MTTLSATAPVETAAPTLRRGAISFVSNVVVTTAAQAFAGTKTPAAHPDDISAPIGTAVLGGTLDKLLILAMGAASAVLLVLLTAWNVNLIFDAFTALGLMIAFYYGITGFACAIYYRHELRRSFRNALFIGVPPVAGGAMLTYVLVKSLIDLVAPDSGVAAIALATMVLGAVLLVACMRSGPAFFRLRPRTGGVDGPIEGGSS